MRFFKYAFKAIIGIAVLVVVSSSSGVSAAGQANWIGDSLQVKGRLPGQSVSFLQTMCAAVVMPVQVEGIEGVIDACIYGKPGGIRLAMHVAHGVYSYAVAMATDTSFTPITNLCEGYARCVYSQAYDTLLYQAHAYPWATGHSVIRDFSKRLELHSGSQRYYQFQHPNEFTPLNVEGLPFRTDSVGISSNGRWAVIEVTGYGFVRLDIDTQQMRRVIAASSPYGYGFDPTYELAISNDGKYMAKAGQNSGFSILEVSDDCGDTIQQDSGSYFGESTMSCLYVSFDLHAEFPGYRIANVPRFSPGGNSVSVYVSTSWEVTFIKIAPPTGDAEGSAEPPLEYIALGDSFSSGEGELSDSFYQPATNTTSNKCHVSVRSYPYLLQTQWAVTASNLACSGSRTKDVRKVVQGLAIQAENTQPSILSLGIGGNDVGLMGKLSTCMQPGTCEWAQPERRIATANEIRALLEPLVELIGEIKTEYAGASLFVVGYPKIINDTTEASCGLVLASLLTLEERVFMNRSIEYLNRVIQAAAGYAGVRFVDIEQTFEGQRLCDSTEGAMNGLRFGDDIAPVPFLNTKVIGSESFHPTPYGHQLVAEALYAQLGDTFSQEACASCWFDETLLAIPAYWSPEPESEWGNVQQRNDTFLASAKLPQKGEVAFAFNAGTFAPHAQVTLELHSDVTNLGTFTAGDDGSLSGTLALTDGVLGYHTVHAVGESASGRPLDVYQAVFIEQQKATSSSSIPAAEENPFVGGAQSVNGVRSEDADAFPDLAKQTPFATAAFAMPDPLVEAKNATTLGAKSEAVHKKGEAKVSSSGLGGVLSTYAVLALGCLAGIGCLYWYIHSKSKEVD